MLIVLILSGSQKVPTSFLKRAFLFSGDVNLFRRAKKIERPYILCENDFYKKFIFKPKY